MRHERGFTLIEPPFDGLSSSLSLRAEGRVVRQSERKAFTLIELLVVIAILSLLVSILLPSLSKAKELARRVMCSANQRSVGLLLTMYSEDQGGAYPMTYLSSMMIPGATADATYWLVQLTDAGLIPVKWHISYTPNGSYAPAVEGAKLFCPSNRFANSYAYPWTGADASGVAPRQGIGGGSINQPFVWTRIEAVKKPAETVALFESRNATSIGEGGSSARRFHYLGIHDDASNMLYADCHVQIVANPDTDPMHVDTNLDALGGYVGGDPNYTEFVAWFRANIPVNR